MFNARRSSQCVRNTRFGMEKNALSISVSIECKCNAHLMVPMVTILKNNKANRPARYICLFIFLHSEIFKYNLCMNGFFFKLNTSNELIVNFTSVQRDFGIFIKREEIQVGFRNIAQLVLCAVGSFHYSERLFFAGDWCRRIQPLFP